MTTLPLRIEAIRQAALDVRMFTLVHRDGAPLPDFTAGAHIELQLPNGLARSYSLLNAPGTTRCYQVAVHRSPTSAGGSRYMHDDLAEGMVLPASAPRNHFPLVEEAARHCLIAGGIGVTPLLAMARRLTALGKPWEMHLCARTPAHATFVQELSELAGQGVNAFYCHFDQIPGGQPLDIAALVRSRPDDTHFYCCGPLGMLSAFEAATAQCGARAHVEYFAPKAEAALAGGYEVELARSGRVLQVPAGRSILDVVTEAGINVMTSCREGICGSCETRIIDGIADHRDSVLSAEEQAQNTSMMICCSGAKSARLVLDL
ncbi:oxidoreductase [Bordetella hinzii]|uniref:PDR/VanB family oxidoreductase n=1 Tax=Bordetella hinzii TaxID=103855 RepID=UPI0013EFD518|nr:PDR/VanB family oxidoreductase [Bordetella hinzii]QII86880.1 oxidoreductase [Bordetella hinzii]